MDLIRTPNVISEGDISVLEQLKKEYPYFTVIDLLLTKAYHQKESIEYHQQLKDTSISVVDREALYNLIYKQKVVSVVKTIEEITEINKETSKEAEGKEVAAIEKEYLENTAKEREVSPNLEDLIQARKTEEDQKLEDLILSSAISSYDLLKREQSIENKKEKEEFVKKEEIKEDETSEPMVTEGPANFYDWLHPEVGEQEEYKEAPKTKSIDELVEEFIQDKNKEKLQRKTFFSPTNIAKVSVVEDDSFVTETLASIYFKQNKYEKAIEAYEKLILKIPEKKTFFANQIEKIKQLLNT